MSTIRHNARMSDFELVLKWETEGVEDYEEAVEVAYAILRLGLERSAGRYGRFVDDVLGDCYPEDYL